MKLKINFKRVNFEHILGYEIIKIFVILKYLLY